MWSLWCPAVTTGMSVGLSLAGDQRGTSQETHSQAAAAPAVCTHLPRGQGGTRWDEAGRSRGGADPPRPTGSSSFPPSAFEPQKVIYFHCFSQCLPKARGDFKRGAGLTVYTGRWLQPKLGGCWGAAGSGGCVCLCPPAQLGLSVGTPLGKPCRPPGSMGGRSWWQRRSWKERREPHRDPRVQMAALLRAAPRVKGRGTVQGGAPHLPELALSHRPPLPLGKDQGRSSERPFGESPLRWTVGTVASGLPPHLR